MTPTDPPLPDGKEFKLQQPPPSRQPSQQTTQYPRRTDSPRLGDDEKVSAPSLDTFPTLAAPNDTNDSSSNTARSPSGQRADASRIDDNLELLRIERAVSAEDQDGGSHMRKRAHNIEPEDAFNVTLPSEKTFHDNKKRDPDAALLKFWMFLRKFPRFVRYCLYLFPGAALLLIPVVLGRE